MHDVLLRLTDGLTNVTVSFGVGTLFGRIVGLWLMRRWFRDRA